MNLLGGSPIQNLQAFNDQRRQRRKSLLSAGGYEGLKDQYMGLGGDVKTLLTPSQGAPAPTPGADPFMGASGYDASGTNPVQANMDGGSKKQALMSILTGGTGSK